MKEAGWPTGLGKLTWVGESRQHNSNPCWFSETFYPHKENCAIHFYPSVKAGWFAQSESQRLFKGADLTPGKCPGLLFFLLDKEKGATQSLGFRSATLPRNGCTLVPVDSCEHWARGSRASRLLWAALTFESSVTRAGLRTAIQPT